ncbi:MAG TPA: hypothetical protein VEF04_05365, partial [Blastocatellia bacterium]|nr:hypothetical protein [Blastocatellia bacterium]
MITSLTSRFHRNLSWRAAFLICSLAILTISFLPDRVHAQSTITVVSAANYTAPVPQEGIVSGFGTNLATGTAPATETPLPTTLAGATVKVKDAGGTERDAPLFYVAPTQINFQIPQGTTTGTATITVKNGSTTVATGTVVVSSVAPTIFTADSSGSGLAAANILRVRGGVQSYEIMVRYDSTQAKMVSVPVDMSLETDQVFLLLYGTGFRNRNTSNPVVCTVGGVTAEVTYAGAQPQFVGLDQINVKLPR